MPCRVHPVAHRYFYPADNLGYITNVLESLAASKELIFVIAAAFYLGRRWWLGLKERERHQQISEQKERLDLLLQETTLIEKTQTKVSDPDRLQQHLDEVTRIKLKALQEFTDEELRADQAFSIFLDQCSTLINKIQLKMILFRSSATKHQD
jgi:hypothetical protein